MKVQHFHLNPKKAFFLCSLQPSVLFHTRPRVCFLGLPLTNDHKSKGLKQQKFSGLGSQQLLIMLAGHTRSEGSRGQLSPRLKVTLRFPGLQPQYSQLHKVFLTGPLLFFSALVIGFMAHCNSNSLI